MTFATTARETLGRQRYINLATFRRTGEAVETPVWIAEHADKLYFFTAANAGKVKRIANDPRIRAAACGPRGGVRGEWIEGRARRVDDPALESAVYAALLAKYGWQMRLLDLGSKLAGRIEGRAVFELDFER